MDAVALLDREIPLGHGIKKTLGVTFFLSAIVIGAFVRIPLPFTPVPVTLQTFFVLLSGAALGARFGSLPVILYLLLGAAGAPIFAGAAGGIPALLGPTGGYLLGFAAAAFTIGALKGFLEESPAGLLALFCAAAMLILACGTIWLKALLGLSAGDAFRLGAAPFIAGDLFKAVLACAAYRRLIPRCSP